MWDLVAATAAFTLIVAVGAAVAIAVTALPWLRAVEMAQSRQFSTARWGILSLAFSGCGLLLAALLARALPAGFAVLGLALCWAAPGVLWMLEPGQTMLGGRVGRHS